MLVGLLRMVDLGLRGLIRGLMIVGVLHLLEVLLGCMLLMLSNGVGVVLDWLSDRDADWIIWHL